MDNSSYKRIIENNPNGIFLYQDDKIIYTNKSFANILGYEPQELTGNYLKNIIHPTHKNKIEEYIKEVQTKPTKPGNKTSGPFEIKAVLKENSTIIPKFLTSMIKNNDNSIWLEMYLSNISFADDEFILGNVFATSKISKSEKLNDIYKGVIELIAGTVETNNIYQAKHHHKIKRLTTKIAEEMGLSQESIKSLKYASMVHGIGKLTVPAEILSSTGELTDVEFSYLKEHPKKGHELLSNINFPWPIAEILYQHHERVDGSGYPKGLKDDDIIIEAKIFAVADVIIAMASQRPYRGAYHIGEVLQEIINQKGKLYDTEVVNACVKVFRDGFQLNNDE